MEYRKFQNKIIVRMDKGEEILEKVREVAEKEKIKLADISALGAVSEFTVGVFDTEAKEYRNCSIQEIMDNYIEGEPQIAKVPVTPDETNVVTNSMIKGLSTEDKTITEGTVTYDIRFLATAPKSKDFIRLILNIEAQKV